MCPEFIKSYENFDAYQKKGHSPRWILWELYHNFSGHSEMERVLKETIDKGISFPTASIREPLVYCAAPIVKSPAVGNITITKPVNINRDLYVPFWVGGQPHIMTIQEDDPKATAKERELFWIISSRLLSSRPKSRFLIWLLYVITAGLFIVALVINMAQPFVRSAEAPLSLQARIAKAIFVLLGV
ncbi:hypothetical protein AU381_23035 [Sinorhizobium glycinis]|uniref:Uncharacterized protein n=2 Tax=Sinorhizobium glycinis TaxID=1472378 RepID=A0A178XTD2_9HYPH|nr:hypothetical protein AU381_23035 [Sinorhizobium glycinis]